MSEKILVSGPVNVVRLEGKLFGINKIIYIFFDFHMPCEVESSCNDIYSTTITQFLLNEFKKINKKDTYHDFFLETFPIGLLQSDHYRGKYINDVRRFFTQAFIYEPNSDKVLPSKIFPKVRLHYIDIRDYLFWELLITKVDALVTLIQNLSNPMNIKFAKEGIAIVSADLKWIIDLMFNKSTATKGGAKLIQSYEYKKIEIEKIVDLINKLQNKYKHKEVQKIVNMMLNDYFKVGLLLAIDKLPLILKMVTDLEKKTSIPYNQLNPEKRVTQDDLLPGFYQITLPYGPNYEEVRLLHNEIIKLMNQVSHVCFSSAVTLVDAYFIRRFLDKDYITNALSYTGGFHSLMYIYVLSKYFDFKVTHASYSKYDIPTLNKKINETELGPEFPNLFYPPELIQCSDLTNFPKNFE
ncbi:MAG: hypothetical protein Hyperionvirus10_52 [Hyperionvirus sp.]|uniref:Uncharacterized protein n=1 Tax=Hyperionvirus sp. TaxID=2487770 RepID=A0A3G5A8W3_9VIRU|nr:MAG: hypothetical protein Hyperionvirus10_52 [Hyperionvirus sp.]